MTLAEAPAGRDVYLLPTSYGQRRLWFLTLLEPESAGAYTEHGALRVQGPLDRAVLQQALDTVVARHEALRTSLIDVDGEPVQAVAPQLAAPVELVDVSDWAVAGGETTRVREALAGDIRAFVRQPFTLAEPPLFRVRLYRLGADDHVLVTAFFHAVYDQLSGGIFARELLTSYEAVLAGEDPEKRLPELPVQYGDFAAWQRERAGSDEEERQLAYWEERLAGLPPLDLPTDRPRGAVQTFDGATVETRLSPALVRQLGELARAHQATPFMTLLAGLTTVLGRYSGQEDFGVGSPVSGRDAPELENLIGFFVGTMVVRAELAGDPSFATLLARTRDQCLTGYAHADVPFERLVERLRPARDPSRSPLFSVMLVSNDSPLPVTQTASLSTELFRVDPHTAKFDLVLTSVPDGASGLTLTAEYNTALFDASRARRLLDHLGRLLAGAVAAPEQPLSALPLLTDDEDALLRQWGTGPTPVVPERSVPALVRQQARATPEREAVRGPSGVRTYAELDTRADRVAAALSAAGVQPGDRVGVAPDRDVDLPAALLGVLRCRAAYVPLDPAAPADRIAWVLQDSEARLVLADAGQAEVLPDEVTVVPLADALAAPVPPADAPADPEPDDLAYVIYTSGSTGVPKGVAVPHRALVNFLTSMAHRPGLSEEDTLAAVTTLSFDIAGLEVFGPLVTGGRVAVVPRETASDGEELARHLAATGATVMQATPATWRLLQEAGWRPPDGFAVWCGGEAFPPDLASALAATGARVWNLYGPTETTVWSTVARVAPEQSWIPLGEPIAHTELLVVDAHRQRVPVGVPGELLIGGAGLAAGYWRRPELTVERFVDHPEQGPPARVYRTGDIVRWCDDGSLEFLGRADHQVKIRGHRIELGEIEAVLRDHPAVRDAVVTVWQVDAGPLLAAHVVPADAGAAGGDTAPDGAALAGDALRTHCRHRLPDYMVPTTYTTLPRFPLTANGKVDRSALPAPEARQAPAADTAPRTATEQRIAAIVAEVLGVERIGVHDDFFAAGGHSLLATRVMSRVRAALGVDAGVRTLFDQPTVARLAAALAPEAGAAGEVAAGDRAAGEGDAEGGDRDAPTVPLLERVPRADGTVTLPASAGQRRLWLLHQLDPASAGAYLLTSAVRLTGSVDAAALRRAFGAVVRRHEALRTALAPVDGSPVQVVYPDPPLPFEEVDLSGHRDPAEAAEELARARLTAPFDLAEPPLLRVCLARLSATDHVLLLAMHHTVGDQLSTMVIVDDLVAAYEAATSGAEPALPPLPAQFADVAAALEQRQAAGAGEGDLRYWTETLAGLPVLDLPTDRPRPPALTYRGAQRRVEVPAETVRQLGEAARARGATLFMAGVAAFGLLLSRYSGQVDFGIGSPVAGRPGPEAEHVVGYFANTLVLRCDLSGSLTVGGLLDRVRDTCLAAYSHADTPFEALVEQLGLTRDLSRTPLAQVGFAVAEPPPETHRAFGGLRAEPMAFDPGTAKTDLTVTLVPGRDGAWGAVAEYATDLFDAGTVDRMLAHLSMLLDALAGDPDRPLAALPALPGDEAAQVAAWGRGPTQELPEVTWPDLFERQVAATPDRVALVHGDAEVTFADLNARANRLAHLLIDAGVAADQLAGIVAERSVAMVVGVLAVHKAGGAYVPIDPSYPPERLTFMIEDAGAAVVLCQQHLADRVPAGAARMVALDGDEEADRPASDPPRRCGPDDLAYVIYTSGSTGTPKGTCVTHRSVVNLSYASHHAGLHDDSRVLQFAPFSFDVSVLEMVFTLLQGIPLIVPTPADLAGGVEIVELINRQRVTFSFIPPSLLAHLSPEHVPTLEVVGSGGEDCPAEVAERWGGAKRFLMGYGPTECTVFSTVTGELVGGGHPPIGKPIVNTVARVYDRDLRPCPIGVPGELYLGGAGLARGYLHRPEQTAVAFLTHPGTGERLYRTGDVVRWLPDGNLEFVGRIDDQVKVRGFRIELGEVAAAMRSHPRVTEAVAVVRDDGPDDARLAGYIVADGPVGDHAGTVAGDDTAELARAVRAHVQERLPHYMVPASVTVLPEMPLTPNGKVDKRALPAPASATTGVAYVAPRTATEQRLARLMAEALAVERVGVDDDFFALGGHSLLAARLHASVRRIWGVDVPLRVLFERPTVAGFAEYLDHAGTADPAAAEAEHAATLWADVTLPADVQPVGGVRWPDQPSEVLVTGATGFLGAFLAARLADAGATVHCLVRGADDAAAQQRLEQQLRRYGCWRDEWSGRVRAVAGDLGSARLGLSEADFARFARTVDEIYHCGAVVDFSRPYAMLRAANVQGTVEMLRMATLDRPVPVHYVSTMSVFAGRTAQTPPAELAHSRLYEHELPDTPPRAGDTGYVHSKWVAEQVVALARARGVPVAVYRPGRIGGDRRTGVRGTDDLVSQVIRACAVTGRVPARGMATDLVPVDYLAEGIYRLARHPESAGGTFHFALTQKIRLVELAGVLTERGWPARPVPVPEWYEAVVAEVDAGDERLAPVVATYGPLLELSDGEVPDEPAFDTSGTRRLLGEELPPPTVDADLLARYVDALAAEGFLPAQRAAPAQSSPTS